MSLFLASAASLTSRDALMVLVGMFALKVVSSVFGKKGGKSTPEPASSSSSSSSGAGQEDSKQASSKVKLPRSLRVKMVLCVRTDLKMGKGKMCAQCGHAALGAYQEGLEQAPELTQHWDYHGAAKIACKVKSEAQMMELQAKATEAGFVNYVVHDAGHTQVAPNTRTVLAILAPVGEDNRIAITKDLSLL
jgi:peptidyl-tRNA hydrolase